MRYFSTFSGIGGFELGIIQAYDNLRNQSRREQPRQEREYSLRSQFHPESIGEPICIGYSEIDKYAIQIYEQHFPDHENYGDITKIKAEELPDFDLLVGGFPCQAFSIAGKRGGFEDTRGTLFFDVARILSIKRPRLLLLENVKGLLSHDEGRTFRTIISALDELGYDVQWQVLNAKDFGVPQNRERVFIVGHLGGIPKRKVFPITGTNKENIGNTGEDLSYALDANYAKGTNTLAKGRRQMVKIVGGLQGHQTPRTDDISPALTQAMGSGGGQTPILWSEDIKIRRLTPLECERLMGFPDGWTEGISDTQRYKTLGNGVVSNVVQAICERLLQS